MDVPKGDFSKFSCLTFIDISERIRVRNALDPCTEMLTRPGPGVALARSQRLGALLASAAFGVAVNHGRCEKP